MTISKVKFLRRGFGFKQDYVSKKLNISRPTLRKKENGESDWTKSEMEILAGMFKEHDSKLNVETIFFEHNFT